MKKVLVTGATGFIGNYVINELLKRSDINVIATSRNSEIASQKDWFSKVKFIEWNLKSDESIIDLYSYFDQPDILIHLAWPGLPNYGSELHLEEYLPAQKLFLSELINLGLKDLTITGTCFEYGMQEGMLCETMESKPENPYAIAKYELYNWLNEKFASKNISLKWLRLFYTYGVGQNPKSLIAQLETALQNGDEVFNMSQGDQIRDFLPIERMAEYIVDAALQKNVDGIINICSNKPISVKDFVENYLKEKNQKIKLNFGFYPYSQFEPMSFWGDDNKLKTVKTNERENNSI